MKKIMKKRRILLVLFTIFCLFLFGFENVLADDNAGSFAELQNLIDHNGQVILDKDYENKGSESSLLIERDITIDLNGHVINANKKSYVFYIESNGSLIINDSNDSAIHKFDVNATTMVATLNEVSGTLSINGGCITGGYSANAANGYNSYHPNQGAGIFVNGGSLIINSGNIIGNETFYCSAGAGIYAINNSSVTMNGGSVRNNNSDINNEGYGGGIYVYEGNLLINDGVIRDNKATYGGGIYYNSSTGAFVMNDGLIDNNESVHLGGGIAFGNANATINGGTISNNTMYLDFTWVGTGGGINLQSGSTLTINGGNIVNNNGKVGGGIGFYKGGILNLYGGTISGNKANQYGGGIAFFNTVGTCNVGGTAVVKDNLLGENINNFYLVAKKTINIDGGDNTPKEGMSVGITMQNPGVFSSNVVSDYSNKFVSDNNDYFVKKVENDLKLLSDIENPTGEIIIKGKIFKTFINIITFGLFFNEDTTVTINASDDIGIKSIEYILSKEEKTLEQLQSLTQWNEYSEFNINNEDKYIVYAKITDKANKVTYISSNGFIIDKTYPLIDGLCYGYGIYYTTLKFTVDEEYIDKVLINGEEVDNYVLPGNVDTTYEIDVYDKAGNTDYMSIRMLPISTIAVILEDINIDNVKYADMEDIEYIINKVNNIDTTYATDSEKEELQEIIDKCDLLLEAIKNKYIFDVDLTIIIPRAGQTIEDNTFEVISKYDNIVISAKEWKLNGGSEVLPNDYVFEEDKLYIPILTVERKNQTHYFGENTTLTIHGSNWSNGENTYKLKDHKDYGYVKELSDGSFIIDEMTISVADAPVYEVVVGANQTYVIDKDEEALFKINAEYSLFEGKVFVDDILLDQKYYTSEDGSTIIKLKKEFVDSLETGKHTLNVEFSDGGKAITNFIIDVLKEDIPELEENPKTGDNITLYVIICSLSIIGLAGCSLYLNRRRYK